MKQPRTFPWKALTAACVFGIGAAAPLQAATVNPTNPGSDSTGTVDVSVTVPDLVWIQRLDQIALLYTPGNDASANEPFCVYSTTGAYDITISSLTSTGTTNFLAAGVAVPATTVTYGVRFDVDTDASDGSDVTEAGTIVNQSTAANGVPPSCASDNAAIWVSFPESGNLDSVAADTYQDTLTLFVEPF